ncbi:polycomb group protein Psc-like [Rhopalosiphum maidis]|uniref:polycomb group protein Psc-like n=1 Tax=Rhopalosiphum maidis TaxID=43146 RepID=UPI000EFFEA63|nr:polycomb group protein Psc-like [Rhopalosiphum maidis]
MKEETPRTLVKSLNPHLVCVLCAGYYIDPTTIVECLHSFCRSCIVKYLETSRFCPICDVQLHKTRPLLSIRRDKILERLVYKIVPGLHAKEMARRALPNTELYLSPDDLISLVLQYHIEDTSSQTVDIEENETNNAVTQDLKDAHQKFLKCPAAVTVEHLKKFLILKYNLTDQHQVDIFHASENLSDDLSLIDIAYCFEWKQTAPMELCFQILEKSTIAVPISEEVELIEDVDMDEDSHSVASSLPFMSSKSISESGDDSNTSLDSKPLFERLKSEKIYRKRKRDRVISDEEPEPKKSLFDTLLQSTTNNNENEDKDFQESDEDYSKYEQDIEEIIEEDDDDDIGRLRISSNISEDEVNNDETTSQMFVIDEAIEELPEEEKFEKVVKEKHWKSEGRNKRKSKKAKHHHHHKRRLSQSPPPSATIVHSPDRDIMKLKVKLNTLPGYRHKDDKHHRHNKHYNGSASSASSIVSSPGRSSYKEDDSVLSEQSCDSVALPKKSREEVKLPEEKQNVGDVRKSQMSRSSSQTVVDSPRCEAVAKEPLQQVRAIRTKPKPAVEQQSNAEPSHKMIIMPPSSITVSIITAEEKLKMEKDKTLMLTGNHDYENKRPSLEIVRVNGPPTTPPITVEVPKSSPKPKEQHEEQPAPLRPKTKKPVPAVIPIKSAKPSITIIPQNRSPSNNNNINSNGNSNGTKVEEIKTSVTISLENGSHNDSALDLSGKSSRKDGGPQYTTVNKNNNNNNTNNNKGISSSHANGGGGQYEPPSMRNLMTLSDTAVHIRNMMSNSSPSPSSKEQQMQQQQQQQQQQDAKKRYNNYHHNNNNNNNHGGNGSCSPKRHNGNVPLRIPVPPTSGSFAKASVAAASQNKPLKSSVASRASDTKPKHGPPNQAVRHIPNPSVLLFRHHQQHLAQFAAAAANAAAVNNNNNNNNKRPNPPMPTASRIPPHPMPAAIPLHTIRKMENLTKNIEKVAAGLSVKANALYKQNFIENGGRARLELPS